MVKPPMSMTWFSPNVEKRAHSCDPNVGIAGQIIFHAMRAVEPGGDYRQDWRKPAIQKKYAGWFSDYLACKIERL